MLDTTNATMWKWSQVPMSSNSIASPALSWHSAVSVPNAGLQTIVYSYGITDKLGTTSPDLYFLFNSATGWLWSKDFRPAPDVADLPAPVTITQEPIIETYIPSSTTYIVPVVLTASTSTLPPVTATALPAAAISDDSSSGTAPKAAVAGSVSALVVGALAAVGVGFYLRRRGRLQRENAWPQTLDGPTTATTPRLPPVSTLLYTRRMQQQRRLSLGSTASHHSTDEFGGRPRETPSSELSPPNRWWAAEGSTLQDRPASRMASAGTPIPPAASMEATGSHQTDRSVYSRPYLGALGSPGRSEPMSASTTRRSNRSVSSSGSLKPLVLASQATVSPPTNLETDATSMNGLLRFLHSKGGWNRASPAIPEPSPPVMREADLGRSGRSIFDEDETLENVSLDYEAPRRAQMAWTVPRSATAPNLL